MARLDLGQHGPTDTFHESFKARTILPQKLDVLFNGSYSYALGRVEQYSPNATAGKPVYNANQPNDITFRTRTPGPRPLSNTTSRSP